MTRTQDQLTTFANLATQAGYQVIFSRKFHKGRVLREITISGYDDEAPALKRRYGYVFERENDDKWITFGPNREKLFELTRQDYEGDDGSGDPALENDWGVWDVAGDDWAHEPHETGYPTEKEALASFGIWLSHNR